MKKIQYLITLLLALVIMVSTADAANKKKNNKRFNDMHLFDVWGGVGYSGMVNNYSTLDVYNTTLDPRFIGGGGGLVGFGYEYRYKKFMLNVGPEFRIFSSQDNLNFADPLQGTRQDYSSMVQFYDFQKYHETQTVGQIMLPILFGGNFGRYYFLAGAKVGYTLLHSWKQAGKLTTSVKEQIAYDEWFDVPSHDLITDKLAQHSLNNATIKGTNPFGLDVALSAEFGINLDEFFSDSWNSKNDKSKHPQHFRVAAFIDYGLPLPTLNVAAGAAPLAIEPVAADGGGLTQVNSIHQTDAAADKNVNSLLVGVKGTWLLQFNKPTGRKPESPKLAARTTDSTDPENVTSLGAVKINIQSTELNPKTKKPKKAKQFATNTKGEFLKTMQVGEFNIWATKPGYFPSDTLYNYSLVEPALPENKKEKPAPQSISFSLVKIPIWHVTVKDNKTGQPLAANVLVESVNPGLMDSTLHLAATGADSLIFNDKKYLGQQYHVTVTADGYERFETTLSAKDIYGTGNYGLTPVPPVKRVFILKNMFFATNRTEILPMSESDLQTLFEFLTENPTSRIRIVGHTDSVGSDASNQRLSEGRSASVKAEMVRRGIDADRIETDGKGESEPIDTNDTEEGRQNNRRVEIQVLNE